MDHPIISPKKLIEVALPLDAINAASAKEKAIRQGHPSSLHLWWARRPLAAARAVIFSQLVHDPEDLWRCQNPGKEPNAQVKGHWTKSRAKLFAIIEDLVRWENTTNEQVLEKAREEIRRSWRETCDLNKDHPQVADLFNPEELPGLHDPFAGGGAIPLEAQRLGLTAYASDLNPVAVLINKSVIEIPPRFAGQSPVGPRNENKTGRRLGLTETWRGSSGLAEDVRRYGHWMRDEAFKKIGKLYPRIKITKEMARERPDLKAYEGDELTVIAWLWARTINSPSPAFSHVEVPLVSSFILSSNKGKEAYVEPIIDKDSYHFRVVVGKPPASADTGTKIGRGGNFKCLLSGAPIAVQAIRDAGQQGKLGQKLLAVVAEGKKGRVYVSPTAEYEQVAASATPDWRPDLSIANNPRDIRCQLYGLMKYGDLFTGRQLMALTTFSDLLSDVRLKAKNDAIAAGFADDERHLVDGGNGALAYAEAISVYLAFIIDKMADLGNTLCRWEPIAQCPRQLFGRQAIPMVWDFAEANTFGDSSGAWNVFVDGFTKAFEKSFEFANASQIGIASQHDAQTQTLSTNRFVSTDPPYYDNIGYADLSDFFYVWLRRGLREVFPDMLATVAVPKSEELVATPYRHGNKEDAEAFFLNGMTSAMKRLADLAHPSTPITIYYAFKQSESGGDGTNSTGWETFLEAVNRAGLAVSGTWPLRTENATRMVGQGTNALASSIVLVCRKRSIHAQSVSRRQFIRELNTALPLALDAMTRESEGLHSPVAPVDLSQAIIGPGMSVFSQYAAVLEADGTPMRVRTALQLINRFLAEDDFDSDSQFCLHWFEQYGWDTGKFGEADTLARAKGTSVDGVKQAGVLQAAGGNVRLLRWSEYPDDWDPKSDQRLPIWEVLHQLIRVFNTDGETGAAAVFATVQSKAEAARQLAYRLYTLCDRKGWAEDARAYNEVVTSWSGIEAAAAKEPSLIQRELFDN
jgi:putative DNA methylase